MKQAQKCGGAAHSKTSDRERSAALPVGRRSLVHVPPLGEKRACEKGQAPPNSKFPPELSSFGHFKIERISHGFASGFRFRDRPVIAALKRCRRVLVLRRSTQIPLRAAWNASASLFLCIHRPLDSYLRHGARRRPLKGRSDDHGSKPNPTGEDRKG
jgi:hypothetical protein